ncbi:MAG TPA: carboxypeptidase-like regulatory domain-containing protein [Longimicrobium sp.]|nr:carboxypeptidase-like regulatory domain-containing protein [Longimicrobium sp.]
MRAAVFALALAALDARNAHAQRVDGRIVDAETTVPVAGATLQLVDEQGRTVHRTVSNGRGYFTLQARAPGLYRIRASRVGYRDGTSGPIDLVSTREREVDLLLSSDAVRLEPLTVTGVPQSARLAAEGFYERREHFGPDGLKEAHFLEQRDIERLNPFHINDIFNHLPFVRTDRGRVQMRRGCSPAIVINGFVARTGSSRTGRQSILPAQLDRNEVASVRSLAGVEVYYGLAIPARYMLDAGGCGVILYWTK